MPSPQVIKIVKQKKEKHNAREKELVGMLQDLQDFINACIELKEKPTHSLAKLNRREKFGDFMAGLDKYIESKLKQ